MEGVGFKVHGKAELEGSELRYLDGLRWPTEERVVFYNVSKDAILGGINRVGLLGFKNGKLADLYVDETGGDIGNVERVLCEVSDIMDGYDYMICLQSGSHFSLLSKSYEAINEEMPRVKYDCVFSLASLALPNIARKRDSYIEVLGIDVCNELQGELQRACITFLICLHMACLPDYGSMDALIRKRDEKRRAEREVYFRKLYNGE